MPRYEVDIAGTKYEVEAPDEQGLSVAIKQIQAQEQKPQAPFAGGMAGAAALGAADTASFGFGDELGAGLGATSEYLASFLTGEDPRSYDELLGAMRSQDQRAQASNPGSYLTGQVAGALGSGVGLARGGISLTGRLAPNASMLSRVGAGAAEGAALGGAYGFGSGEGGADRLGQAATDAGLGLAMGGAIPVLAQGASSAYRSVADRLAGSQAARQAGTSPEVARMLAETLEADGSLGPQGMASMQRAGNEAMLADAGPNARAVLDTAIQRGGPGGVLARGRIDERVARDAQALTSALDQTLGTPQGLTSANTAIRQGTASARKTAYDAAYDAPIDYADPRGIQIEEIVKGRVPASAISKANELMRVEGLKSKQIKATIADDGTVTFESLPDVRQLDYITRGLNDVAAEADGKGALGGTTAVGRAYSDLSGELRSTLRDLVPEYGNALDTAVDAISQSKAVKLGGNILSPASTMDDVAIATKGMSKAERDALKQGIRSNIDNRVANVTRTLQDGNTDAREAVKAIKDLSSRANREKVAAAIGDQEAKQLFDEVDRVAKSFDLRASVSENSKTFARQAVSGRIGEMTAPGPVGTLAQGEPINAGKRIIQALTGQTPERITARENKIYSQIADYLTRPSSQAIPAFQAMQNYGTQTAANQARALQIARLLSQSKAGVYPTSVLLGDSSQK